MSRSGIAESRHNGLGGGVDPGDIVQDAARRAGPGDLVYWCLVTKERLTPQKITGSVVVIQTYLSHGVVSLVTTDEDAVLGVPPHCFEEFIGKEGWGPREV